MARQPLAGVCVLDFSMLLPGPLATLMLAEAGAEVIKIERPGRGDEMRSYTPKFGADSVNFALLNRGKRSIAIDLKNPLALEHLLRLVGDADALDAAITDNLFTFMYWAIGNGLAAGEWPKPGGELVTGGSPRYQIYRTADDQFVAAAPVEEKFWDSFCTAIGLEAALRDDTGDPAAVTRTVAERIRAQPASYWRDAFSGKDVCARIVKSVQEALADPHFIERGLFARQLVADGRQIPALAVPLAAAFRGASIETGYPSLGVGSALLDAGSAS